MGKASRRKRRESILKSPDYIMGGVITEFNKATEFWNEPNKIFIENAQTTEQVYIDRYNQYINKYNDIWNSWFSHSDNSVKHNLGKPQPYYTGVGELWEDKQEEKIIAEPDWNDPDHWHHKKMKRVKRF